MTIDMREAVHKSALMLDIHEPGWENHIDKERLNLAFGDDCILGQLHGCYVHGAVKLGIKDGKEWGFILARDPRFEETSLTWQDLKELWIEEIECRILATEAAAMVEEMAVV